MSTRRKALFRNTGFTPFTGATTSGVSEMTQASGDSLLFLPGMTLTHLWVQCFGWPGEDAVTTPFANIYERHIIGLIMTFGSPAPMPLTPMVGPNQNWLHWTMVTETIPAFNSVHMLTPNHGAIEVEANRGPVHDGEKGGLWFCWECDDTDMIEGWSWAYEAVVLLPS